LIGKVFSSSFRRLFFDLDLSLSFSFSLTHVPLSLSINHHHHQLELKEYLTKVYGFDIATLRTSVLAGKKKRGKAGNSYARPDIKKVYVSLKSPPPGSSSSSP
jgi:ribosomal protein L23